MCLVSILEFAEAVKQIGVFWALINEPPPNRIPGCLRPPIWNGCPSYTDLLVILHKCKIKCASPAEFGFNPYPAAVAFNDFPDNGQSGAGAAPVFVPAMEPLEYFKNGIPVFLLDADAVIPDKKYWYIQVGLSFIIQTVPVIFPKKGRKTVDAPQGFF